MSIYSFVSKKARGLISGLVVGVALMFPAFTAIAGDEFLDNVKDFKLSESPVNVKQTIAAALIEKNAAIVIDVRSENEYQNGHIPGAFNIPHGDITSFKGLEILKEKDTPVLLYCRSGRRSGIAMNNMSRAGYKHVMNMGGIITWEHELSTEPPAKSFEEAVRAVVPLK